MRFVAYTDVNHEIREQAFKLYVSSFPQHERRSESCHTLALGDPEFVALVALGEDDALLAILFYWQHGAMIYVEHIAVNPLMRGQNIGSSVLSKLVGEHPEGVIILEIDPPIDDVAVRRLRFYSHLGFVDNGYEYVHPSYSVGGHAHKLLILSHGRAISQDEFDKFSDYINNKVLTYID